MIDKNKVILKPLFDTKSIFDNRKRFVFSCDSLEDYIKKAFKANLSIYKFIVIFDDSSDVQIGDEVIDYKILLTRIYNKGFESCTIKCDYNGEFVDIGFEKCFKFLEIIANNEKTVEAVKEILEAA